MQYRRSDVVAWLREFSERPVDDTIDEDLAYLDFLKETAARFPKMMRDEYAAAIEAFKLEQEADREAERRELEELEFMIAFNTKHKIPSDMPWVEAVRMVASRGDPEALGILKQLDSPEAAVTDALLNAAVDAHPAWRREGQYYAFDDEIGGPEDSHSLIDWYQRTHPHDASALTDRILNAA